MLQTIAFTVAKNGITPDTVQPAGMQGDHNVAEAVFTLDDALRAELAGWDGDGYAVRYRVDAIDSAGRCHPSGFLEERDGAIRFPLTAELTEAGGLCRLHLIVSRVRGCDEAAILYAFPALLHFTWAQSAGRAAVVTRISGALAGALEAEKACTALVGQAAQRAEQAEQSAGQSAQSAEQSAQSAKQADEAVEKVAGATAAAAAAREAAQQARTAAQGADAAVAAIDSRFATLQTLTDETNALLRQAQSDEQARAESEQEREKAEQARAQAERARETAETARDAAIERLSAELSARYAQTVCATSEGRLAQVRPAVRGALLPALSVLADADPGAAPQPDEPVALAPTVVKKLTICGRNQILDGDQLAGHILTEAGARMEAHVPRWSAGTWYFALLLEDGTILSSVDAQFFEYDWAPYLFTIWSGNTRTLTEREAARVGNVQVMVSKTVGTENAGKRILGVLFATDADPAFEPYVGQTDSLAHPVTLRRAGAVSDEYDVRTGKITRRIRSWILPGDAAAWTAAGENAFRCTPPALPASSRAARCSHYSGAALTLDADGLTVTDSRFSTPAELAAWLAGESVEVWYEQTAQTEESGNAPIAAASPTESDTVTACADAGVTRMTAAQNLTALLGQLQSEIEALRVGRPDDPQAGEAPSFADTADETAGEMRPETADEAVQPAAPQGEEGVAWSRKV